MEAPAGPTVFVVDDDPATRVALHRLVASASLRAESFAGADEFLQRASQGLVGCLVLDIRMPGRNGFDLYDALQSTGADIPVIFLSGHLDVELTVRAMRAGAVDVLTKPCNGQALLDAVSRAFVRDREQRQSRRERAALQARVETLTAREREVMTHVVRGEPNRVIAEALGASEKTIKAHRGQVMRKMRAESVADLVRYADRLGFPTNGL